MGSKAEYEAAREKRQKVRHAREVLEDNTLDIDALDLIDRLATSFERMAEAMEKREAREQAIEARRAADLLL